MANCGINIMAEILNARHNYNRWRVRDQANPKLASAYLEILTMVKQFEHSSGDSERTST